MEIIKKEVTNYEKLCIFTNWTLKALGIALIAFMILHYKGYPTPFKSLEAMQIQNDMGDIALAISAAQEDILELHKKVKK